MHDDRLESWKDIAAYFRRDIRTVQRWEKLEGLPIHRHAHHKRSTPFAYPLELEAWWKNRGHDLNHGGSIPTGGAATSPPQPGGSVPPLEVTPTVGDRSPDPDARLVIRTQGTYANPSTRWMRRIARTAVGVASVLLLGALILSTGPPEREAGTLLGWIPPISDPPSWILVAEFEGPADEADLAEVTREMAISALAQSEVVTPISTLELQQGLRDAMLPETTRVRGEVARQLACRAAARAYVEGRIDRVADGYSVALRMIDAEDGALRFSMSALAESRDHLIPMLDDLSRRLREELGENEASIRRSRFFLRVMTPSFEAFRLYQSSLDANIRTGDKTRSRHLAQQALVIDPDFALAWGQVAVMAYEEKMPGYFDSSRAAYEEALRRPQRLTPVQRLVFEASYRSKIPCDLPAAYAAARQAVLQAQGYEATMALNMLAIILGRMERPNEAYECFAQAATISPFGPDQIVLLNLVSTGLIEGRLDDARQASLKLLGFRRKIADLWLAQAQLNWPRVESLARDIASDPSFEAHWAQIAALSIANARAAQGDLREAMEELETVAQDSTGTYWPWFARFVSAFVSTRLQQGSFPQPPWQPGALAEDPMAIPPNAPHEWVIEFGLLAAARADTLNARRALQIFRGHAPPEHLCEHGADAELIRAWIAFDAGRWGEVLTLLEPVAAHGPGYWTGRLPCRWLVAESKLHLGDLEGAAAGFELTSDLRGLDESDRSGLLGFVSTFAHARLLDLYSQLGLRAEAERHRVALRSAGGIVVTDLMPQADRGRLTRDKSRIDW